MPRGSLCWTFRGEGLGAAGNLAVSCSNPAGAELSGGAGDARGDAPCHWLPPALPSRLGLSRTSLPLRGDLDAGTDIINHFSFSPFTGAVPESHPWPLPQGWLLWLRNPARRLRTSKPWDAMRSDPAGKGSPGWTVAHEGNVCTGSGVCSAEPGSAAASLSCSQAAAGAGPFSRATFCPVRPCPGRSIPPGTQRLPLADASLQSSGVLRVGGGCYQK